VTDNASVLFAAHCQTRSEESAGLIEYCPDSGICPACPLKAACTPSTRWRTVHRHRAEAYLERVRLYHQGEPYKQAMRKRQVWVEPLFAEGKQWQRMRRFRHRRLWQVNSEAVLIATGLNLKRLLQQRGWGHRPFPGEAAAVVVCFWILRLEHMVAAGSGVVGYARDLDVTREMCQTLTAA
jgi:Transposase DDE domain